MFQTFLAVMQNDNGVYIALSLVDIDSVLIISSVDVD